MNCELAPQASTAAPRNILTFVGLVLPFPTMCGTPPTHTASVLASVCVCVCARGRTLVRGHTLHQHTQLRGGHPPKCPRADILKDALRATFSAGGGGVRCERCERCEGGATPRIGSLQSCGRRAPQRSARRSSKLLSAVVVMRSALLSLWCVLMQRCLEGGF